MLRYSNEYCNLIRSGNIQFNSSIYYGASGVAIILGETINALGSGQSDRQALWLSELAVQRQADVNFFFPEYGVTKHLIGSNSFFYGAPGVFFVNALLHFHAKNTSAFLGSAENYLVACEQPVEKFEMINGNAGLLLGCLILYSLVKDGLNAELQTWGQRARSVGDQLAESILTGGLTLKFNNKLPLHAKGIAHGYMGMLYVIIKWNRLCGTSSEKWETIRLLALELLGDIEMGHLSRLSLEKPNLRWMLGSWCNGATGYVLFLALCYMQFRDHAFLEQAIKLCDFLFQQDYQKQIGNSLCCGYLGHCHALLSVYKHTNDLQFLINAKSLYTTVANGNWTSNPQLNYSLFAGKTAIDYLESQLNYPSQSKFPLLEWE
jgi:hypothetical protein